MLTDTQRAGDDPLDEIRGLALAAIQSVGPTYTPARYPWIYSADFLTVHPGLIPADVAAQFGGSDCIVSRQDKERARQLWAESIGADDEALARIFADAYLIEKGIPLGMANAERLRPLGASDSSAVTR